MLCAAPNVFCVLILLFLVPESPKFTYAQGEEKKTLEIFQRIHRMNHGKSGDLFEVTGIIKNEEFGESSSKSSQGFFRFMWMQSVPLFQGSHLRNILTASFIQFASCNTINGFWTFLPEIMNKISLWTDSRRGSATVCEIFSTTFNVTSQDGFPNSQCIQKLEFDAFLHAFESIIFFGISYIIMTLVINKIGKLIILTFVMFSTGACAVLLIFIKVPTVSMYLYMVMLLAGLGISIVNASTVELFPTKMRAMAVCISMMVGRLGSVTGSIVIGMVIGDYCDFTFLMPTILLLTSGVSAFTIPNISKRF